MQTLKGKVKKFIYNSDNFGVAIFNLIDNEKKSIVITGPITIMKLGIIYEIEGELFINNKLNKTSFVVETVKQVKELTSDLIIHYLSSSLFPTIGKTLAKNIFDFFKDDVFKKILDNPNDLMLVKGMTKEKSQIIQDVVKKNFNENPILDTFLNNNLKIEFYNRLQMDFENKEEMSWVLKNDFYKYANNSGLSPFEEVDKVALAFGEPYDSEKRISWWANMLTTNILFKTGDTYTDLITLRKELIKHFPDIDDIDSKLLYAKQEKILYFQNKKVYTKESFEDEEYIAKILNETNEVYPSDKCNKSFDEILTEVEEHISNTLNIEGFKYNEEQVEALESFYTYNLIIITGGPGTGKTTVIMGLVKMYKIMFNLESYAIAAPTGRAAGRIKEASGYSATTIHKLLKYSGNDKFDLDEKNPTFKDLVILDECSMIDNHLFACLLKGVLIEKKLVLVGDVDQLPSVNYGNLFQDLIESNKFKIITLTKNNRQTNHEGKENKIINLANSIKESTIRNFDFVDSDNLHFIFNENNDALLSEIKKIYSEYRPLILEDELTDIQIVAPMYKNNLGIINLNEEIQELVNPSRLHENVYKRGAYEYRKNDKVMYIENDPKLELSNGDVGFIEKLTFDNKKLEYGYINFNARSKFFKPEGFSKINLNYACSIHKTQGSEYNTVILVLDDTNKSTNFFTNKKMIYTAITRAKKNLFILSNKELFLRACSREMNHRKSTLKEKIIN